MSEPAEIPAESAELVAALSDPRFYPHRPERVELVETHISWVFLADELAYKVKKPLRLPFLDYGTLERRHHMCREEVRLNRRLAPDYYLGVGALVRTDGGYALADEDDPGAVEYVVEMRTIRQRRTLDRVVAEGGPSAPEVEAIGERLARFHGEVAVPDDPAASVTHLLAALSENLETLRERGGAAIADSRLRAAEHFTASYLEGGRELLERRAGRGLVRDGHGDLRTEHVIVEGEIQAFDCVEFDPELREIDVAADLAFLIMDLERLGATEAAAQLPVAYREAGGDPGEPRLLAFLASYRAWVRAKVALFKPDVEAGRRQAGELHALGHRFAWRARGPFLLFVCGVAASGKSTLAAALGAVSGLAVIDADSTRKRLAGIGPTERAAPEHYSAAFSRRTYAELGAAAARELERSGAVIVDATGRRQADRDAFREGLDQQRGEEAPLLFARCEAPAEVLIARARAREDDPERISDADAAVVAGQLAAFEPIEGVARERQALIDTDQLDLEQQVEVVEALLDGLL
jgi:aminoglycoside phosphotransferase family enzyme/predicted kinase